MLKRIIICVSLIVSISASAFAEDQKSLIAVLELTNQAKLSRGEISTLSQFVREGAMQLPPSQYMLITKENISVILPPDMRLEDCIGECEVETGRLIGAHYILSGQVVKFGSKIQINLTLHDTKTAEIKASGSVNSKRLSHLEKPLRDKTIELLVKLEPSLERQSVGLKQGLRLERRHLAMIPNFENNLHMEKEEITTKPMFERPSPIKIEVDENAELKALELLDHAVTAEKDPNIDPQRMLKMWEGLSEYRDFKKIASSRASLWSAYLKKISQHKDSQKLTLDRKIDEIKRGLERLSDIGKDDRIQEEKRKKNMHDDWSKLSRLLALSVIPHSKKQSLATVFVETYGVHEELNPYMKQSELVILLDEGRRAQLLEENIQEKTEQFRRSAELSKQRALLIGRYKELQAQAKGFNLQATLLPRIPQADNTHMMASALPSVVTASPSEWYCVCYLERYRGRPTMSTACRLTSEACNGLRDKVMEGTRVLVAGSAGPCVRGAGETPWEATLSQQSVWRPSKRAGAWWTPEGCFNGQSY